MPAKTANGNRIRLTLRDRLSRLSYQQACRLLGSDGERLLREGGRYEINIARDVQFTDRLFRARLNGTVVKVAARPDVNRGLLCECSECRTACEHIGGALALILEEKMTLGLAAPPPERVPIESLTEDELVERALTERRDRATAERLTVQSTDSKTPWTDYLVTNRLSGKSYRVALRGWEPGESYCTCPDFRKNTLGVCKHVFAVQDRVRRRFTAAQRNRKFKQKNIAIHLRYGRQLELRLLLPDKLDPRVERAVRPVRDRPIEDVPALVKLLGKLEALGEEVVIYPDAEQYLDRRLFESRVSAKVAEIRKDPAKHPLRKELLKAELLPYQLDGIAFAVGAGRAVLADDMGLGKTIQGIGVAEMLARERDIRRVLVICPATLKSQWQSEIHRFCDRDCQLVLGGAAQRAQQYQGDCFFTVCNYEQVLRDIMPIEKAAWDLIILDEGQRIKNWEAKTSRIIKSLRSPFALVLSGTPLENRLDDLFSVVEFIDDRRLGPAFRFFNHHRVLDEDGKILGYKNLAELRERLAPVLLRRTRASVMRELPKRSSEIIRITPTDEQIELHRTHLRIVLAIIRKPFISEMDLLRLRRELLVCRMAANSTFLVDKQEPGYSSKMEVLRDLLASLLAETDRKIVLFSEWTTMLGLIEPILDEFGAGYVRLDGSVPQKKRQQLVHRFQRNDECRVFVTTNAGATGLNLQAANTVVNVDLPWNPAVLEQRIARAHRMGQKRPVQVYVLVTESTLEESLLGTLAAKQDLAMAALDADSDVDFVKLISGTEQLKRRLEMLLGKLPDAPVDESEKARQSDEAKRLARREQIGLAGGQLLGAAFSFVEQLLPQQEASAETRELAGSVSKRLAECVEKDEQGRLKLTVTLPDPAALDQLAQSLARLIQAGG